MSFYINQTIETLSLTKYEMARIYFHITVTLVSLSMSLSISNGDKPVLQQISSKLESPVYIFCLPEGTEPVNTGYL